MKCEECGILEIEHPMDVDHPEKCPVCGGEITRYFGNMNDVPVHFVSSGGGVDDWTTKQAKPPQHQTSIETGIPYR